MSEYQVCIHEPSTIHHTALLGNRTVIWQYSTVCAGVMIGDDCIIGACCFLGAHSTIGDGTRVHHGAAMPAGMVIGKGCYIGVNVCFTDVGRPSLLHPETDAHRPPVVEDDVTIGCNSVILPGVIIHAGAVVGAGAVVTRDVPSYCIVVGNPARLRRKLPPLSLSGVSDR